MKSTVQTQRWYGYFFMGISGVAALLALGLTMPVMEHALLLTTALALLVYGFTYQPHVSRGWWRVLLGISLVVMAVDLIMVLTVAAEFVPALFSFALPFAFLSVLLGFLRRRVA
ncbi:hypothetical protein FD30_GL000675 [Levilactobacillus namurensis DSM 19117]|uniref:Uncharacterized protein n=2 Tax=Levilactobacillus namurensis TaxID=380393 RepID=A0A0R1KBC7_9LACO|nr:hypothetical protein [Levilactobacillus namurensis]PTM22332.1 hypothetical protein DA798_07005 [Lactobacillus sp. PFC-70]KRK77050.1 hypothetical protein FD30_GL000675 [Levilactobacillus namurensis DSM 19117]MCW3777272.1 hypothetical protein [Levilactobacillus namurensis]MDT7014409.1 hypothetical protein [Levilactobacillus namurensis]MDT7018663.1 hypothetical protein [Levilactobacillus namurensis]